MNYIRNTLLGAKEIERKSLAEKHFPSIGIERKKEWVYILNRSKIVAKLRESVGEIEEFSDSPQTDLTPTDKGHRYSHL